MKLIDKDALVAEIKRRKQDAINNCGGFKSMREHECDSCIVEQYEEMKNIINTLEVKEVDLDKELDSLIIPELKKYKALPSLMDVAKHFFELGMAISNPVTAADRGIAEEIIINLKQIEKDYHIDLTKEMEWLRNKVKTGE